jgi:hypothetical protein
MNDKADANAPMTAASAPKTVNALLAEVSKLDGSVKRANRRGRWKDTILILLVIGVCVLLAGMYSVVVDNRDTGNVMADCTTPGGECYERGNARTGEAIAELDRRGMFSSIAIVLCSRELGPGSSAAWKAAFVKCVRAQRTELIRADTAGPAGPIPVPAPSPMPSPTG